MESKNKINWKIIAVIIAVILVLVVATKIITNDSKTVEIDDSKNPELANLQSSEDTFLAIDETLESLSETG
jgi:uncharacterized membrane protein YvbJ